VKPDIELHIKELVLHGFKPGDRYRIVEAVEKELTRLLAEQGLPLAQGAEVARLDGGLLQLSPNQNSEAVGKGLAGNIYQGIKLTTQQNERS
jgi:hypothetical protein